MRRFGVDNGKTKGKTHPRAQPLVVDLSTVHFRLKVRPATARFEF